MGWQKKHLIRLALIVAVVVAGILWAVFLTTSPKQELTHVHGIVETAFGPSQKVYSTTQMTVKLDNGVKVGVELPRGLPYIPGAHVELAVTAVGTAPNILYRYTFVGYRDQNGQPAP